MSVKINKGNNREELPVSKQKINDNKRAIRLEKMGPPYYICNIFHGDQLETLHFPICHSLIRQ